MKGNARNKPYSAQRSGGFAFQTAGAPPGGRTLLAWRGPSSVRQLGCRAHLGTGAISDGSNGFPWLTLTMFAKACLTPSNSASSVPPP